MCVSLDPSFRPSVRLSVCLSIYLPVRVYAVVPYNFMSKILSVCHWTSCPSGHAGPLLQLSLYLANATLQVFHFKSHIRDAAAWHLVDGWPCTIIHCIPAISSRLNCTLSELGNLQTLSIKMSAVLFRRF